MPNRFEGPQLHDPLHALNLMKNSIESRIVRVENVRTEEGQGIKKQIGRYVEGIKEKVVLPDSIKIADLTPVSSSRPTVLNQAKYSTRTNEIYVVTRNIAVITDFRETDPFAEHLDPEETRPIYVPIPEEQQVETVVRVAEDAEWVRYGQTVVEHLESAVLRAQDAKKQ